MHPPDSTAADLNLRFLHIAWLNDEGQRDIASASGYLSPQKVIDLGDWHNSVEFGVGNSISFAGIVLCMN